MNLMSTLMLATNLLDERFFDITKKVVKKSDLVKGGVRGSHCGNGVKCTSIKEQAPNADGLKASLIVPLPILFYL